jgi:hypothetical protein
MLEYEVVADWFDRQPGATLVSFKSNGSKVTQLIFKSNLPTTGQRYRSACAISPAIATQLTGGGTSGSAIPLTVIRTPIIRTILLDIS